MIELKPCAHCGDYLLRTQTDPVFWNHPQNECLLSGMTVLKIDVSAWNTRQAEAQIAQIKEAGEGLAEALEKMQVLASNRENGFFFYTEALSKWRKAAGEAAQGSPKTAQEGQKHP